MKRHHRRYWAALTGVSDTVPRSIEEVRALQRRAWDDEGLLIVSPDDERLTDLQLIKTKKGEFACTLEELIAVNLGLALYGTTVEQTAGTVTGEVLPNPVTVGSLYLLAHQNVSSVVVKDSAATPVVLPEAQYSANAKHGSLAVNDKTTGGPYTEPFQIDYAYGAAQSTAMFTQPLPERWVREIPGFRFEPVLSDPGAAHGLRVGLVHEALLEDHPDLSAFDVYMSGPPAMIDAGRRAFVEAGLPEDHLYYDSFDYAPDVIARILHARAGLDERE